MFVHYGPITLPTIPGNGNPPLRIKGVFIIPFWELGLGGVLNIWPVKPFEINVIKSYLNKIHLT